MYVDLFHILRGGPMAQWLRELTFVYRTYPLDHLTAVSCVGSSPTRGKCETGQVLLAGVSGVFFYLRAVGRKMNMK